MGLWRCIEWLHRSIFAGDVSAVVSEIQHVSRNAAVDHKPLALHAVAASGVFLCEMQQATAGRASRLHYGVAAWRQGAQVWIRRQVILA